ncbi:MAG: response regulator [Acidobacteriia bacterium]|nr:response regulator [Terriglobia bacterium]
MARVLVVEDNSLVAKFYRLALERAGGHQVTCTEEVDEILRLIEAQGVDVVILDVSLRNCRFEGHAIDGLELAQLIRQRTPGRKIPILLATAHAMEGDRQRLLAASGADAYLEKPIYDPQVLISTVAALMGP